jgi:hypothetical protein
MWHLASVFEPAKVRFFLELFMADVELNALKIKLLRNLTQLFRRTGRLHPYFRNGR